MVKKETDKMKLKYSKNTISFNKTLKKKLKKDTSGSNIIYGDVLGYEMNEIEGENSSKHANSIANSRKKYSSDRAISPVITMDSKARIKMPHNQPRSSSKKN